MAMTIEQVRARHEAFAHKHTGTVLTSDSKVSLKDIAYMANDRAFLLAELERLQEALRLILPLAKGYAHAHPVGSNQEYVNDARAILAQCAEEGGGP